MAGQNDSCSGGTRVECGVWCGGVLQFAAHMGAVVSALDRNADKGEQVRGFGASEYVVLTPDTPATLKSKYDLIINWWV